MTLSRRRFLQIAGVAGGAVALRSFALPGVASASPQNPQLFLACYFSGGWDQMLALDPRDNTDPKFQQAAAQAKGGSGIWPAYDMVKDARVQQLLMSNKTGIQKANGLTFGPAIPASFLAHAGDVSLCRGVFMGTLGHDVGRRYFITGKFPRGLTANGSSLGTAVASAEGKDALVPNLAISTEAYNATFPAYATPIGVNSAADVQNLLKQIGTPLDPNSDAALHAFEKLDQNCEEQEKNGFGLVDLFRGSREKARSMVSSTAATQFNFKVPAPTPEIQDLFDAFNIKTATDLSKSKGKAAIAAVALTQGISQAVSLEAANDLDDHDNWGDTHATNIMDGFDAVAMLISYLKAKEYKQTGDSTWAHTTLLMFSEFARTPMINGRDGRDHHIASSCLVAGPKIKPGVVVGGTSDWALTAENCDFSTGKALPDDSGNVLRPPDIHATLLQSMGLPFDQLMNQSPVVIEALLK